MKPQCSGSPRSTLLLLGLAFCALGKFAPDARAQKPSPLPTIAQPDQPEQKTTAFGGTGGSSFSRRCPDGKVLTGLRVKSGLWIDAVGLICRPVLANGSLGSQSSDGPMAGGSGGTIIDHACPAGMVIVRVQVDWDDLVGDLRPNCRDWNPSTRQWGGPGGINLQALTKPPSGHHDDVWCESARQPAAGIHGRAGSYLDAFGIYCDEP